MKTALSVLLLASFSASADWDDCDYSKDISRSLDLDRASLLMVEAGAGSLEIKGEAGRSDVLIDAVACASSRDMLDEMDVKTDIGGKGVLVATDIPSIRSWTGNKYARINLTLIVPEDIALDVKDSSGSATVYNVGSLVMKDSSGSLEIADVDGEVLVDDSSGSLRLENIGGRVEVSDSSGGISAVDLGSDFIVLNDSSGDIKARRIKNDVIVENDSSGSIDVKDVGGDFVVKRDGSGSIDYSNVVGKLDIPSNKRDRR